MAAARPWRHRFPRGARIRLGPATPTTAVVFTDDALLVIDIETGRTLRSVPTPRGLTPYPTPPGEPARFLTRRFDGRTTVLEAWDGRSAQPVWSRAAPPWGLVGDGRRLVWQEADSQVTCVDLASGRELWRLPPESGGAPFALIDGVAYLKTAQADGRAGQVVRRVDALRDGRTLGVQLIDPNESALFHPPRLLNGPGGRQIFSESMSGVGVEGFMVRAFAAGDERLRWERRDLQAEAVQGDTLLGVAVGRDSAPGVEGVDAATGRTLWRRPGALRFLGAWNGLWLLATDRHVLALRPSDGVPVRSLSLRSGAGSLAEGGVAGDRLIVLRGGRDAASLEGYPLR